MTKTMEAKALSKYALSEKIKKGELLRLLKVLDTQSCSLEEVRGSGKINASGPGYSKGTLDLLRRYFVLRMAASREYVRKEVF